MTMYSEREVKCRLCNHVQKVHDLVSCSTFGAPDFDARPAEMARGAIMSIQVCPFCGYAAFDIEARIRKPEIARNILSSLPKSKSMTDDFYKAGEIVRQTSNNHSLTFAYFLRAAWSADDEGDRQKAKEMRSLALKERLSSIQEGIIKYADDLLQACDIARRAEQFDVASELVTVLESKKMKLFIRKLASYEKDLIAHKDTACHSVSEIERKMQ